jgi:hypothetical protein
MRGPFCWELIKIASCIAAMTAAIRVLAKSDLFARRRDPPYKHSPCPQAVPDEGIPPPSSPCGFFLAHLDWFCTKAKSAERIGYPQASRI